jgi:hypothetical protein
MLHIVGHVQRIGSELAARTDPLVPKLVVERKRRLEEENLF